MRLLVIRLSALGDVAILAPVLRARAAANPDVTFLLAAPPLLRPLFSDIDNVEFIPTKKMPPKELAKQWAAVQPDAVADLHGVRRVRRALRRLRCHGIAVHHVRKHRLQRWHLIRRWLKRMKPLPAAWQRYDRVFADCGLNAPTTLYDEAQRLLRPAYPADGLRHIGIAPGAQHRGKVWPTEQMEELVRRLSKDSRNRLTLFGGKEDQALLERWANNYPNTQSMACKGNFADELKTMQQLDVMVTMDSANLHFASALGVPAISIWGATHPAAGFYGWRQDPDNAVQLPMPCRPCSAYGQRKCRYGDYRCMKGITAEMVINTMKI